MTSSSDLVAVMAELHAALRPGDLAQTLRRVTDAAVELLPDVDGATITVEHDDGRFETAAATGSVEEPVGPQLDADTAARLDHLQRALEEGPAVDVTDGSATVWAPDEQVETLEPLRSLREALTSPDVAGEPGQAPAVTTTDLASDDRYPNYGYVAAEVGVRAQVAVVLFETERARGVLNLYSQRPGAFDETAVLADLFARHSATALAYAVEYQERETRLAERRDVGQALGIVMGRYQVAEADAFALLQQTAERRQVSVRLVAQELVAHAEGASSQP
jgi:hypothetical protein